MTKHFEGRGMIHRKKKNRNEMKSWRILATLGERKKKGSGAGIRDRFCFFGLQGWPAAGRGRCRLLAARSRPLRKPRGPHGGSLFGSDEAFWLVLAKLATFCRIFAIFCGLVLETKMSKKYVFFSIHQDLQSFFKFAQMIK